MLQDIRQNSQGAAAKVIIGLIVISFAFFGIQSILVSGGSRGVAEVNGEEITPQELQQAVVSHTRRLIAMMGENYDPAQLDEDRVKTQALETLISRKVMTQSVEKLDLAMSEAEIGILVSGMEQFQVEGKFDPVRYKLLLSENGFTPSSFKQSLSEDMMLTQLRSGMAGTEFATPGELKLNAGIVGEQRDFRYLTIPGERFAAEQAVSDEDIQVYYSENEGDFLTQETVDLAYIELTLDNYREPVSEESVQQAFQSVLQGFQPLTENRVSHILLTDSDAGPVAERVSEVQAKLAEGADFSQLAQEYSDDVGSASRGGDLGYSSGQAFPEAMETAVAALEPGKVSDPVGTASGTHILLLTERRESEEPSLEKLRPQLEASLQEEEARIELLRDVEALRDLTFNADDLQAPAAELGLEVVEASGVTRGTGVGLFEHAVLREAAYSDDVLTAGHNSDVVEVAGNHFAVLRVKSHNEPQVQALEEVREQITGVIKDDAARKAVASEAERILNEIRSGEAMDNVAETDDYEWQVELAASRGAFSVAAPVLARVFELPLPEGVNVSDYILMDNGDAVVIELTQVHQGVYSALSKSEQEQLQGALSAESGALVDTEFQQALRQTAEIVVM